MRPQDLHFSSALELAQAIRDGSIDARSLARHFLDRIARSQELHAYTHVPVERALALADAADRLLAGGIVLGPLHGVPVAIKDAFAWEGTPLRGGSRTLAGNVSARVPDAPAEAWITPRGLFKGSLSPAAMVRMDARGERCAGDGTPSSESKIHAALLAARPDVTAVVHCHAPKATTLVNADLPFVLPGADYGERWVGEVDTAATEPVGDEVLEPKATVEVAARSVVVLRCARDSGTGTPAAAAVARR